MSNQNPIPLRDAIIMWLNQVGYSKASYDRLISNVPAAANYDDLRRVVNENPTLFRTMNIRGGLEGLVYLTPGRAAPSQVEEQPLSVSDVSDEFSIPEDSFTPVEQLAPIVMPVIPVPVEAAPARAPDLGPGEDPANWKDIGSEEWREYTFRSGPPMRVYNPKLLKLTPPPEGRVGGGSHRIVCEGGRGVYIPSGWLKIEWKARDSSPVYTF